jgi:hypothetical protein
MKNAVQFGDEVFRRGIVFQRCRAEIDHQFVLIIFTQLV